MPSWTSGVGNGAVDDCVMRNNLPEKQCKQCKRWLPEDRVHFYYGATGVAYSPCKECRGYSFSDGKRKTRKQPTRQGFAWCTQCDQEFELSQFTPNKRGDVDSRCRACRQINKKARRTAMPDVVRAEDKKYRERRRIKRAINMKIWKEKNREHVLIYHRQHNATPERKEQKRLRRQRPEVRRQELDYAREYNQRPYAVQQRKLRNKDGRAKAIKHRYRARRLNLPNSFTKHDWLNALDYFNNSCAVCGRPRGLWHTLAADHWIPLSAGVENNPGTVATNIVPLCHGFNGCNNSKHRKMPTQWLIDRFGAEQAKIVTDRVQKFFQYLQSK